MKPARMGRKRFAGRPGELGLAEPEPRLSGAGEGSAGTCLARSTRKPMARALRVALFEREIRERLSGSALEILFSSATRLSEGSVTRGLLGNDTFYGSTMLTIDLASTAVALRDPCDAASARKVAAYMGRDRRVVERVRELAGVEAAKLAGRELLQAEVDLRVRSQGVCVYLDVDVEGELARPQP